MVKLLIPCNLSKRFLQGAEGSASSLVPRRTFTRTSGAYAAAEEVTLASFS